MTQSTYRRVRKPKKGGYDPGIHLTSSSDDDEQQSTPKKGVTSTNRLIALRKKKESRAKNVGVTEQRSLPFLRNSSSVDPYFSNARTSAAAPSLTKSNVQKSRKTMHISESPIGPIVLSDDETPSKSPPRRESSSNYVNHGQPQTRPKRNRGIMDMFYNQEREKQMNRMRKETQADPENLSLGVGLQIEMILNQDTSVTVQRVEIDTPQRELRIFPTNRNSPHEITMSRILFLHYYSSEDYYYCKLGLRKGMVKTISAEHNVKNPMSSSLYFTIPSSTDARLFTEKLRSLGVKVERTQDAKDEIIGSRMPSDHQEVFGPDNFDFQKKPRRSSYQSERNTSTSKLYNNLISQPVTAPRVTNRFQGSSYKSSYPSSSSVSRTYSKRRSNATSQHRMRRTQRVEEINPLEAKFQMDPRIRQNLSKKFLLFHGIELRGEDIVRLQPGEMLNDAIIDFHLLNLQLSFKDSNQFIFNTQFYQLLKRRSERDRYVRTVPSNTKLFEKDFVYIPINESLHWSLIVLCYPGKPDHRDRCMLFCDSMYDRPSSIHVDYIRDYLERRYKVECDGAEIPFDEESFPIKRAVLPKQNNYLDCGVYMVSYIERFFKGKLLDKLPINMPNLFPDGSIRDMRMQMYKMIKYWMDKNGELEASQIEDSSDDEITVVSSERRRSSTQESSKTKKKQVADPPSTPDGSSSPDTKKKSLKKKKRRKKVEPHSSTASDAFDFDPSNGETTDTSRNRKRKRNPAEVNVDEDDSPLKTEKSVKRSRRISRKSISKDEKDAKMEHVNSSQEAVVPPDQVQSDDSPIERMQDDEPDEGSKREHNLVSDEEQEEETKDSPEVTTKKRKRKRRKLT